MNALDVHLEDVEEFEALRGIISAVAYGLLGWALILTVYLLWR